METHAVGLHGTRAIMITSSGASPICGSPQNFV